jgi:hypothetical protein
MANEFRDRMNRLERKCVNHHGRVQIRPEQRESNVKRVVIRVNTNMNEFVTDNADMSDVNFKNVFVRYGERLDNNEIVSL